MHEVLAFADLDDAAAEPGDVVDRRLKRAVVGAHQVGILAAHGDPGQILHGGVHRQGQLLFARHRREVLLGRRRRRPSGGRTQQHDAHRNRAHRCADDSVHDVSPRLVLAWKAAHNIGPPISTCIVHRCGKACNFRSTEPRLLTCAFRSVDSASWTGAGTRAGWRVPLLRRSSAFAGTLARHVVSVRTRSNAAPLGETSVSVA